MDLDEAIAIIRSNKDNLQARHLLSLARILEVPPILVLDKSTETANITKRDLEMLAVHAYSKDFIGASKVAELLHISVLDARSLLAHHNHE
ncbi:MAG: hypothetical protein ACK5X3_14470 [Pseudomonadota bacterium]|jgi:hypothetical protein